MKDIKKEELENISGGVWDLYNVGTGLFYHLDDNSVTELRNRGYTVTRDAHATFSASNLPSRHPLANASLYVVCDANGQPVSIDAVQNVLGKPYRS